MIQFRALTSIELSLEITGQTLLRLMGSTGGKKIICTNLLMAISIVEILLNLKIRLYQAMEVIFLMSNLKVFMEKDTHQ